MAKNDAPIIVIKRVKKGGHGHHGGAWKIAYADFVTAMMAFFLLMWVLGSTTAGDLAGISAYFQNPLRVSLSGGQGSGDATRIIRGGGDKITKTVGEEARADADTEQRRISDSSVTDVENARKDKTKNEQVKEDIQKKVFDKSAGVRRFETPRQKERDERRRNKERALREARESENLASEDKKRK